VTGADDVPRVNDVDSIIKRSVGRQIDEIFDIAKNDPEEALKRARRHREWLKRKMGAGQGHQDLPEVIKELGDLIDILRRK
jgi:hypothetical protein